MAAQIPIKSDPVANDAALEKVRQDKLREVTAGHDGTWVAHPGLVPLAHDVFDAHFSTANQIARKREDVSVTAADLLEVPDGTITERGLRTNIDVGIQYLAAWLGGNGCVPIYHLMEDAATAEISRTQVWQWLTHWVQLDDGRIMTADLVRRTITEELEGIRDRVGVSRFERGRFDLAARLFTELVTSDEFPPFMTTVAYDYLD
jgi:malate synthase